MEQQEAVVMPGKHAVDRAAVQFGSMGLNGTTEDLDVDSDREEAETRAQPPQHSPIAPRASLPPSSQAQSQSPADEALPTPRQAPGLPPPGQHSATQSSLPEQPGQQPSQPAYPYNHYGGRYGLQDGQPETQPPAQKAYEPFGQQLQQQYGGYPTTSQAPGSSQHSQAPAQQPQSQMSGYSGAPSDMSSFYTSDNTRNAYQNYYGSYGQQPQQNQPESGTSQQRVGSGFSTSAPDQASQYATSHPQQQPQSRYGQAAEAQTSGQSTQTLHYRATSSTSHSTDNRCTSRVKAMVASTAHTRTTTHTTRVRTTRSIWASK